MTNNHFEKRIQEKLNQFEIEPSENLFNHLIAKRAAKSKSFFRFSYAKFGVALLAIVAITVLVLVNQSPKSGVNSNAPIANIENTPALAKSTNEESRSSENIETTITAESPQIAKSKATTAKLQNTKSNLSRTKQGLSKIARTEKRDNRAIKEPKPFKEIVANTVVNNGSVKGTKSFGRYQDNGTNISERYFNVDSKDRPLLASQSHKGQSHLYVYHTFDEELINSKDLSYLVLKPLSVARPTAQMDQLSALEQKEMEGHGGKKRNPIFIDLYYSALLTTHGVSDNNNLERNYQALSKINSNQALNVRISTPLSNRFNIFTGIGMNQLNTKFEGLIPNTTNKVHYETSTFFINDPITGKPTPIQHTDTVLNGPVAYKFSNSYKLMQIPIGLSYNMGFKRFDLALNGAAVFNLTTQARGTNPNFELEQMSNFNSNQKHLGLGASISLMVAYKLTNKIRLIAEPGVQFYKINARKNGNAVNENIFNKGFSLGIRYTLF